MRVLMTADAVGGVWTYAAELSAGVAELGVEVVLAVMGPTPTPEQRRRLPELAGYYEAPYALEWMNEPWEDVDRAANWLLGLTAEAEPEVVHLNGYVHASAGFGVPVLVVGHSCVLSWHEAVRRRPAGPEWSRYARAVRAGLRAADAVVAPTRAMLEELQRLYGVDGDRLVIPNGRSRAPLEPLPKRPCVLGVGRAWDDAKNLAALERVAPELPWPVTIGGGDLAQADLYDLYRRAAIFAEPARYEPFGLAALEAGLAGCALVLGDVASLREVWGDTATFVDPFDDDSLAAELERLIADDALRQRMSHAARTRALRYTPARMAGAYARLYAAAAARQEVAA